MTKSFSLVQELQMGKPYGERVVDCPDCKKPIGADHPYEWCCECGNPLKQEIQEQIPSLVKRAASRRKV